MVDLRAYAVALAEVRGLAGAGPTDRERLRAVARRTSPVPPPRARDLLGPIHLRVPGAPVLPDDGPTPDDLEALLAGAPVPAGRVLATWHLVERLVGGLALGTTRLADADVSSDLLAPLGLSLPPAPGLVVGWCTRRQAAAVRPLRPWLAGFDGAAGWTATAVEAGRPPPVVVVLARLR